MKRITADETRAGRKDYFWRLADIGLEKAIVSLAFDPRNPFEPEKRRLPSQTAEEQTAEGCMTEMLVTITGFGSVWRRRFGKDENDPKRFARVAYFNTTGVLVSSHIRTRPKIIGHARFNGVGGFDPNHPLAMINSVFECAEPCVSNGRNKVLFERMLPTPQQPDYFLVVVRAVEVGRLEVGSPAWRSEGTLLISFSESRDQQEAMLLMPPNGWLRTALGRFDLKPFVSWPWSARLQLESV